MHNPDQEVQVEPQPLSILLRGGKFYHGPDLMVAPHLPVGSPERAALFERLRETFAEDWAAAEEALAEEKRTAKGDLYFVRVGRFLKIGRTTNLESRMRMIRCHASTPPELVGTIRGGGWQERDWHRQFRHLQSNREWFRITPELKAAVNAALASTPKDSTP
jgi:hypothetical protein